MTEEKSKYGKDKEIVGELHWIKGECVASKIRNKLTPLQTAVEIISMNSVVKSAYSKEIRMIRQSIADLMLISEVKELREVKPYREESGFVPRKTGSAMKGMGDLCRLCGSPVVTTISEMYCTNELCENNAPFNFE